VIWITVLMQRRLQSRASSRVAIAGMTGAVVKVAVDGIVGVADAIETGVAVRIVDREKIVDRSRMLMAMRSLPRSRRSR
jgi:hypothetical protein